jgi:hypothetical protein
VNSSALASLNFRLTTEAWLDHDAFGELLPINRESYFVFGFVSFADVPFGWNGPWDARALGQAASAKTQLKSYCDA